LRLGDLDIDEMVVLAFEDSQPMEPNREGLPIAANGTYSGHKLGCGRILILAENGLSCNLARGFWRVKEERP
jgi:hypothetical protein